MWDPLSIYPDDIDMRVFGFESIADADRHRARSSIRFVQVDENVEDFDVDMEHDKEEHMPEFTCKHCNKDVDITKQCLYQQCLHYICDKCKRSRKRCTRPMNDDYCTLCGRPPELCDCEDPSKYYR